MPSPLFPTATVDLLHVALGLIIIINLALLGAERHRMCIRLIALQGLTLGFLPFFVTREPVDLHLLGVGVIFIGIKVVLLPWLLRRTYLQLPTQGARSPYLGYSICVLLGLAGLTLSIWLGAQLGISANPLFSVFFPIGLSTVITGILLIVTRREALAQVFGYLVMENGIYLMGVPLAQQSLVWLELSVLLDILVAAFVMGIAIHHIHRAFESTDMDKIASLRD